MTDDDISTSRSADVASSSFEIIPSKLKHMPWREIYLVLTNSLGPLWLTSGIVIVKI